MNENNNICDKIKCPVYDDKQINSFFSATTGYVGEWCIFCKLCKWPIACGESREEAEHRFYKSIDYARLTSRAGGKN